jgi:hypothetical protein
MAAEVAPGAGWPREVFAAKMRAALSVGDRILWIGAGFANVRRRDGRVEAIYQRS